LAGQRNAIDGRIVELVAEVDRDELWGATGARSVAALVAWKTGSSSANATTIATVARRLAGPAPRRVPRQPVPPAGQGQAATQGRGAPGPAAVVAQASPQVALPPLDRRGPDPDPPARDPHSAPTPSPISTPLRLLSKRRTGFPSSSPTYTSRQSLSGTVSQRTPRRQVCLNNQPACARSPRATPRHGRPAPPASRPCRSPTDASNADIGEPKCHHPRRHTRQLDRQLISRRAAITWQAVPRLAVATVAHLNIVSSLVGQHVAYSPG
jgi:hypothetical protein